MDTPWRKPARNGKQFAGLQYAKDAKIQRPRKGLVEQNSFVRTVENAATAAQDASKLQWDFGKAAEGPHPYTALDFMKSNPEEAGSHARPATEAQLKIDNEKKSSYL